MVQFVCIRDNLGPLAGKFTLIMTRSQQNQGLAIKLARVRQGLHLYEVARLAGISSARLSQYEGGHRQIPSDVEDKLRALLGMRRLGGTDEKR